jgi:hypothetical protein
MTLRTLQVFYFEQTIEPQRDLKAKHNFNGF